MGSNAPGKLGATAPITDDTIVAIASPPGQGGVGIIRISGSNVPLVASALLGGLPPPRHATLRDFKSIQGEILDRGLALFFPTPNSYTGDDLLELHGHGSPVVLDLLVREICTLDVRLARAGEFTERAFLNEKLDLAQAEAVADLISAGSAAAARGAMRSLQGVFSDRIHTVVAGIVSLRTFIEATIDFPDEDVEFLAAGDVSGKLDSLLLDLSHLRDQTAQGVVLKEGVRVALAGQPNVGKSSVLNALAQEDIALVTNIPGTTRDVIREYLHIDGLPLVLMDTAGRRESEDLVEQLGTLKAKEAAQQADMVLLVVSDEVGVGSEEAQILQDLAEDASYIVVRNKIDLTGSAPGYIEDRGVDVVRLSAKTGDGLDALKTAIRQKAGYDAPETVFMARRRHLNAIDLALAHLRASQSQLLCDPDTVLLADELRQAHDRLGEIVGVFSTEDLLGEIFSTFCIGK